MCLIRLNILYGRDRYLKEIDKGQVALIQHSAEDKLQSPANYSLLYIGTDIKRFLQKDDSKMFHLVETAPQQNKLANSVCLVAAKKAHLSGRRLVLAQ